jgi:serine/threonine protein kinase
MTTIPLTCAIHSDGSRVKSKIIGMGIDAFIIHNDPSTVLKIPKLYGRILPDGTTIPEPDNQWANDLSIEKAIYERLDNVPGIASYLGATKDGLLLKYYKNGCLEDYMQQNPLPPKWSQRMDWILQMIDVYAACHAKNVLVCDIALRNLLLADDYTIRAIDFANSSLHPLEEVGELKDADGYSLMVDVLHVTNVIYSLSSWMKFQVDCIRMEEWPRAEGLPSTRDLPLGDIIARSWSCEFKSLGELRHAVVSRTKIEVMLQ